MSYSRYYVRLKGRCAGNTPPQVKTNMSVSNSSRENCVGSIEDVTKEQLVEIVVEQQSTIEDLKQRLSEVEDEQQETRRQQAEDRQRIAAVEETVEQLAANKQKIANALQLLRKLLSRLRTLLTITQKTVKRYHLRPNPSITMMKQHP